MSWQPRWRPDWSLVQVFIKNFAPLSSSRLLSPHPSCWKTPPQRGAATQLHWIGTCVEQVMRDIWWLELWINSVLFLWDETIYLFAEISCKQLCIFLNHVQSFEFTAGGPPPQRPMAETRDSSSQSKDPRFICQCNIYSFFFRCIIFVFTLSFRNIATSWSCIKGILDLL